MKNAKLIISRTGQYANRARNIQVLVDGKKIGEVANGETKGFLIEEGAHDIQAKIDWCKTRPVAVVANASEPLAFELGSPFAVTNKELLVSILQMVILFAGIYISSRMKLEWLMWVTLIISLGWIAAETLFSKKHNIIYYLTIGRHEYLYLKQRFRPGSR